MPRSLAPMLATLAEQPPKGDDWLFEIKWDGVRALAYIDAEGVRLFTRNGNPCEKQYPELQTIPHYIDAETVILDSEVALLDDKGVARFELIQPRIHNHDAGSVARMAHTRPVTMFAFDLLYVDGWDLRNVALIDRKALLEKLLRPCPVMRYSEHFFDAGDELLALARQTGIEGVMAKRANSCYEHRRGRDWLKIKVDHEQDCVLCGYTRGERDYFSSLILGLYRGGQLVYVGNAGTGFDNRTLEALFRRMQPLTSERCPFGAKPDMRIKDAVWLRPELVCAIRFANWTGEGRLRAPVYHGIREDVDPRECVVPGEEPETPAHAAAASNVSVFEDSRAEVTAEIDGRRLKFTNLNKLYWPDDGYTKRDMLRFYEAVAPLLLPHLKDRPLSLKRYPNGIKEEYFFQKDIPATYASWLRTEMIRHNHNEEPTRYVIGDDKATLLYLANLGCIDQNPWFSRAGSLDHPDIVLIDLDPQGCEFAKIVEAALLVRRILDAIGLEGYPKTTGGDGLHIYIPIEPVYTYDEAKTFAELIAMAAIRQRPNLFTTPRAVAKREHDKVYFDYLQNGKGKTIAAPYVTRAHPGAPVATPLAWREVTPDLLPSHFNLRNAMARFDRVGDLFEGVLTNRQTIEEPLEKLGALLSR